MELLNIGNVLARHRRLVAIGLMLAVLSGLAADRRVAEGTSSGVAVQRVLVGPPDAPAIKADYTTNQTLIARTRLIGELMTTTSLRHQLRDASGLSADQFAVIGPAFRPPTIPVPLAVQGTRASATAAVPYVLTVESADATPIMTLTAGAPTAREAQRFVSAGTAVLGRLVGRAYGEGPGLTIQDLGPISATTAVNRPSYAKVAAAPIVTFLLWCSAIVLISGITRHRRREAGLLTAR